jgi:transcriptional regulator
MMTLQPPALPLLKGTLDVLVLKALSDGTKHGFAITQWLAEQSAAALTVEEAAVYQSLYRLEARGVIKARWGVSEKGRRARFYQLTTKGGRELDREIATWRQYASILSSILDGASEGR